jgi:hypothetical protein
LSGEADASIETDDAALPAVRRIIQGVARSTAAAVENAGLVEARLAVVGDAAGGGDAIPVDVADGAAGTAGDGARHLAAAVPAAGIGRARITTPPTVIGIGQGIDALVAATKAAATTVR